MKAYILKLSFEDCVPLIWRRVILPADVTFHRLHQMIQTVTNFQSDLRPYHSFGVEADDYFITDNESLIKEYKNKKYAGRTVKQPRIKIDNFLEENGEFIYNYDFGDNWRILVELEKTVDDYYFGYPTLLEGESTAPPEDVGGPPGYQEFLTVYEDLTHPDFSSVYSWAVEQSYLPLDIVTINRSLKHVNYKKTEWQFIDHKNYAIQSDKYRGVPTVNINHLNKDLIFEYAIACVNLYGIISHREFLKIYNAQNHSAVLISELTALLSDSSYKSKLEEECVLIEGFKFVHEAIEYIEDYFAFSEDTIGKPMYIPEKDELLRYTDGMYYEKTSHQEKLAKMLAKDFYGGSTFMVKGEIDELVGQLETVQIDVQRVLVSFLNRFNIANRDQLNEYIKVFGKIANSTRIWENKGHTPEELFNIEKAHLKPLPTTPFQVIEGGKPGRNDSCPCSSGKKYKKCCGK